MESKDKQSISVNLKNIFKDSKLFGDENYIVSKQCMDQFKGLHEYKSMASSTSSEESLKVVPNSEVIGDRRKRRQFFPYTLKCNKISIKTIVESDEC